MDFQIIVDSLCAPSCIVSVEKRLGGGYGDIRLAAGNKKYADLLDVRMRPNVSTSSEYFVPGLLYTEYF